jgi:hypothetical protein
VPATGDHLPGQQELSEITQVLMPRGAGGTVATRRDEREDHVIAGLQTGYPGPDLGHDPGALMAAYRRQRYWHVSDATMVVGMAHTAGCDFH